MKGHPVTQTINVGLIGAGWFGREAHLTNLLKVDGVQVIAASSRSDESLQQVQAMAGNSIETFTDWQRVLEIEAVDAVVIALTNDQHHAAAMAAFAAGKHVLCEKPLSRTIKEAEDMIRIAKDNKIVLKCGFNHRHHPAIWEAKKIVDKGELGKLLFAQPLLSVTVAK